MSAFPLSARNDWTQTRVVLPVAVALVAFGIFLVSLGGTQAVLFGLFVIVFSGLVAVIVGSQLFVRGNALTIDSNGILDRRATNQVIPWSAIVSFYDRTVEDRDFVSLTLAPPAEQFFTSPRSLAVLRINRRLGESAGLEGDMHISANGLTVSLDQIREAMRIGMQQYGRPQP